MKRKREYNFKFKRGEGMRHWRWYSKLLFALKAAL